MTTITASATTPVATPRLPLLTSVASVCALRPAIDSLDHVTQSIDACLDPSGRFNVEDAVATGSARLLERVLWFLHNDSTVDVFVRELWVRKGLQAAVRRGAIAMVQIVHQFHQQYLAANALELAAERGDTELLQWLYEHRYQERDCIPDALIAAATIGSLPIIRYLLDDDDVHSDGQQRVVCPPAALRAAIEHGHCDVVRYLTDNGVRAQLTALDSDVARHGHMEMVKWLHVHASAVPNVFTTAAMDAAAGAGHFEIVQFLHAKRTEGCRSWAMDGAATGGYLEIVEFLFANRREGCTARAVNGAARNGHLHILHWFYDNLRHSKSIWTSEAATAALVHGHYEVLEWLQTHVPQQSSRLPPYAAVEIAKEGNLRGLQLLHDMHGPDVRWSSRVMDVAAASGDVDMAQWLFDHRPNDSTTTAMDRAAEAGQLTMIKLLHVRGLPCTTWAMDKAAGGGYLDVVKWFHENRLEGCTVIAMDMAAASGHLEVVQWLHENRTEGCTSHAMDAAAIGGHLDVVVWLHEHRNEGCTVQAIDRAAALDNWEVVQWLVHNNLTDGYSPNGIRDTASRGRLRILRFMESQFGLHVDRVSVLAAARNGYLDVVQWALEDQLRDDFTDVRAVAEQHGHFHITEWLDTRLPAVALQPSEL